jgi:DNA-3-methyladenine glycosylase
VLERGGARGGCVHETFKPNQNEMRPIVEAQVLQQKKTVALARWLLGKHLVRRLAGGRIEARMITETEAYIGEKDLACHARAGRTGRTDVMYGPGGVWYVYLCYGIHEMLNLVVGPDNWPAAILIRGVEGAAGPGRVTKALQIDRSLNRAPAAESSGLWLEDRGVRVPAALVTTTARIGVDYAGPVWAAKPWRFIFDPRALPPPRETRRRSPAMPGPDHNGAPARWEPVAPTLQHPSVQRAARNAPRLRRQDD